MRVEKSNIADSLAIAAVLVRVKEMSNNCLLSLKILALPAFKTEIQQQKN